MKEALMPRQRLSMRQIHEVLRLKWAAGLSERQIARSLGLSRPTVAAYVRRAQMAGVSWPLPDEIDAATLDQRAHLRRNVRLCITPCPTISCMAMEKRANIAYLI